MISFFLKRLPPSRNAVLLGLFFLSGLAGIVYEQVWTRLITLVMGSATYAVSTTVAAFMAGLGLGAWAGGRVAPRLQRPAAVYGALEILIGLYALALPHLLDLATPLYRVLYQAAEGHALPLTMGRFAVCFVLLLPPTGAMGATLPLAIRQLCLPEARAGVTAGRAYAANTAGGFAGALAGGFALLPRLANSGTLLTAAAASLAVGAAALAVFRRAAPLEAEAQGPASQGAPQVEDDAGQRLQRAVAFWGYGLSGLAAMALQIAWTRAGVMALDTSAYAFSTILATCIAGLALGGAVGAKAARRVRRPLFALGIVQAAMGLAVLAGIPWFDGLPAAVRRLYRIFGPDSFAALAAGKFLLFGGLSLGPTFFMGMAYPLTVRVLSQGRAQSEAQAGAWAYGFNSICAVAGAFLAGFVLIPGALHTQGTLVAGGGLAGAIGLAYLWLAGRGRGRERATALAAGAALLAGLWTTGAKSGRWDRARMLEGNYRAAAEYHVEKILYYHEGVDATVAVTFAAPLQLIARIDGKPDASNGRSDGYSRLMLGHYAALLAPKAERALLIGLGGGMTLNALTSHSQFKQIDCVELVEGMIQAADLFKPYIDNALDDPRLRLILADGRTHLALSGQTYDLIVSEPTNPWVAGASALFSREFYSMCRRALRPGGVAAFWTPGFAISLQDFEALAAAMLDVFPYAAVFEGNFNDYIFVCSDSPLRLDLERYLKTVAAEPVARTLARIGYRERPAAPLSGYLTDGKALRKAVGRRMISDANSTLEFSASRRISAWDEDKILQFLLKAESDAFNTLIQAGAGLKETAAQLRTAVARYRDARRSRAVFLLACQNMNAPEALASAKRIRSLTPEDGRLRDLFPKAFAALGNRLRLAGGAMHAKALEEEVARLLSSSPPETSPAGAAADSPQSLVQRGLQAVAAQQYDSADSLFRKAYQMDPNYVAARVNLARLALARGRAQEALELLAPYRSHEGLAPNLRFILASALAELGRTDEALAELDKALSKGFSDTALLATSPYFASLRQTPAFAALLRKHYIDLSNIADRASDRATSRPLSLFPPAAVQNQATSGAASLQAPLPPPATR